MKSEIRNKLWVDLRLSPVDQTFRAWVELPASRLGFLPPAEVTEGKLFDYLVPTCIAADWDKQRCLRAARRVLKAEGLE